MEQKPLPRGCATFESEGDLCVITFEVSGGLREGGGHWKVPAEAARWGGMAVRDSGLWRFKCECRCGAVYLGAID